MVALLMCGVVLLLSNKSIQLKNGPPHTHAKQDRMYFLNNIQKHRWVLTVCWTYALLQFLVHIGCPEVGVYIFTRNVPIVAASSGCRR
nr:MAG TPA: hypothetical protein [Caudoviricetes sp.]